MYSLADNCVLVNARADVCDYLKDWCNGAAAFFRERIIDDFSPRYREMLVALDLRVLILPQVESVVKEQLSALKKLWIWSCRSGRVDLPADFAVMEAQHRAVIETLTAAMAELRSEFKPGKHRVPFQQKLVHGDQSTSGPRPAGHVPISKSTGLVVAVLRVGLQQEGARPRIRGWTTDLDS